MTLPVFCFNEVLVLLLVIKIGPADARPSVKRRCVGANRDARPTATNPEGLQYRETG